MLEVNDKLFWEGKPIETLSKAKLIEIVYYLANQLKDAHNDFLKFLSYDWRW